MGMYDRDYWRQSSAPGGAIGGIRMWSVNTWLIAINIAVFVLNGMFHQVVLAPQGYPVEFRPIEDLGYFSVTAAIYHLQIWRFITFQFLHANLEHILFNMIALYFFGPLVESFWGSRRYLAFYLLCGMAGPVMYIILWRLGVLIAYPYVPLIGASAGIFGVLIAGAMIAPNATVLIYGIIPARLRVVAWLALAFAAYSALFQGANAGGDAAHLGGAAAGFVLMRYPYLLNWASLGSRRASMRIRQR